MAEQGCGFLRNCEFVLMSDWHHRPAADVLRQFSTSRAGLDDAEAQRVLERVGPNRLERTRPISAIRVLRDQFKSVVVYLLIAATVVSFALGDLVESIAIAAVLAINTIIGFVTSFAPAAPWNPSFNSTSRRPRYPLGAASNRRCRDDCAGRYRSARCRPRGAG